MNYCSVFFSYLRNHLPNNLRKFCVCTAAALICLGSLAGEPDASQHIQRFDSGHNKVALIELYTSEGCSSCPPADRWLSALAQGSALWREVVPLAFHVSYWDQLGWPDRFAQRRFDSRQRALAQRTNTGVYTPGVFLDGREFRGWRKTAPQAISAGLTDKLTTSGSSAVPGNLSLNNTSATHWQLSFTPASAKIPRADRAYIALLGNKLHNNVTRGENRGKQLEHDFVVLKLDNSRLIYKTTPASDSNPNASADSYADSHANTIASARFSLSSRDPKHLPNAAIAAWVVDADGKPIQAVGGALNRPGKWLPDD